MAGMNRFKFLLIAIAFHLVYIYSIFDVYFVSPIVSGMRSYGAERPAGIEAPADRLVLFVADGLRADKTFQYFPEPYPETDTDLTPRPLTPFLRSLILEHATFGVSHTRVPTESRPGHVALIAGLYEDVSAVTTGWKLNPVNFDSVFNKSQHTWCWGSPDILPMFQLGAVPGRVDAYSYPAEDEDFSQDAAQLDTWVFNQVDGFFSKATKNATLEAQLRRKKVIFFLHLLGLDTNGHAHRPYSKEYLSNIKVVDEGIKKTTKLIENFYNDSKTAFVFTADHGMSDWGSHGDGHPDNTRTPLIAWGSGVAKPVKTPGEIAPGHDEFSSDWSLNHIRRHDVSQADVAALMAYLAGLDFPVNSVGKLPLEFLSGNLRAKAEAFLANTRGILEMYRAKEDKKKENELTYRPFQAFNGANHSVDHRISSIRLLIDQDKYKEAIQETNALFSDALQGLRYLQTYDWLFLRALITIGYLGWIAFALSIVIDLHVLHGKTRVSRTHFSNAVFLSILINLYYSLFLSKSPYTYYAYAIFPVAFWEEVFARRTALINGKNLLFKNLKPNNRSILLFLKAIAGLALIESLALGYSFREVFSVLFVCGAFWPMIYGKEFLINNKVLVAIWALSCLLMSSFTLFPAMKVENLKLIMIGDLLMVIIGINYLIFENKLLIRTGNFSRSLVGIQIGFLILAMIITYSSVISLKSKLGLPVGNQILGWAVIVCTLVMPLLHQLKPNKNYLHRLLVIFLTFSPTFVILTISYEGLFYVGFWTILITWVQLECTVFSFTKSRNNPTTSSAITSGPTSLTQFRSLTLSDIRISLYFLTFLQSAFFSTGNIASISAFSLDSVYRLIPIFDPFSQGALLIFKLMIPFAVLSANVSILNKKLGVPPSALFMIVIAVSDFITLHFFWVVKDEGSWLEIGSSISHFCIASLLCIFVACLDGVGDILTWGVEFEEQKLSAKLKEI
ncbi:GPI ethanolamine phosphate transferase 1 [Erysiphe neolycopersici]|uniref:GPI ethanolamine phosphate transferase 1 n=1 Tax=Erysiphe neolycopersici TaxID=212602 RepID=A0A420HAQ3_9PEZI|nr:GPI ethanolamine phosphate transferase 1 [Erysiphe neolycopersici]